MNFIPKSHFLAKKVDFLTFFTHFGHFEGLLTNKDKNESNEKVASWPYLSGLLTPFFHFQQGKASKCQKTDQKSRQK